MLKLISKLYYKLYGWKVAESFPKDLKKCVILGAPHTDYRDFFYGLAGMQIAGLNINYLAKKELFKFPFGFVFSSTGGIPVDRNQSANIVDQVIEIFNQETEFFFALSPEATRGVVKKWKSGFYHIALGAKVPIVPAYLDYKNKHFGFGPAFMPTGDTAKDLSFFKEFYKTKTAKVPEKFDPESICF